MELRNNFEREIPNKELKIRHWVTSSKYDILDEVLLKNFTSFHLPTLGSELTFAPYINIRNTMLIFVESILTYVSKFEGFWSVLMTFVRSWFCNLLFLVGSLVFQHCVVF